MKRPLPGFLGLPGLPGRRRCAGALLGPPSSFFEALLRASLQVELYDEEMGFEPFRKGILTGRHSAGAVDRRAEDLVSSGAFVFRIGYPPEISIGAAGPGRPVVVLSPDGVPRGWEDELTRDGRRVLLLGRRTGRRSVKRKAGAPDDLPARSLARGGAAALGRKRFRSPPLVIIDPLVFDPSVLPVPGNIEPGGLGWYLATDLLRALCAREAPAGAVLLPCRLPRRDPAPAFVLARLVAKVLAYALSAGKRDP